MRLIDADALKREFHSEWDGVLVWDESGETTADQFCNIVDNAPTIEAEPVKTGKWIDPAAEKCYRCSVCEEYTTMEIPRLLYHYCPNCGAKMENT